MYRILVCLISLLYTRTSASDHVQMKLSTSTNPILKEFYDRFIAEIKIANEGKYIDDIDNNAADLMRYHFGLTNEDKHLNASQLIIKYGYAVEQYELLTPDGYLVTTLRIPGSGPPVLLMHGMLCSVDEFLSSGPGFSLAYLLADANYDVWMPNARGNKYSMKHISLSPTDIRFWNFSFHEIGVYDLPTNIDFILTKLNLEKLYFIGHSQGTTTSYVMLSERPEYNEKLILLISFSPIAWMNHLISPVIRALVPIGNVAFELLNVIGVYDLLSDNVIIDGIKATFCGTSVLATLLCGTVVMPAFGFDYVRLNFTNYPVQLAHVPAGSSNKQIVHYSQMVPQSEQFQQFDYGDALNLLQYGSARPPPYPVWKITAKTALFYSDGDWVSNPVDVDKLASKLRNLVLYHKVPSPFGHMDYYWAKDINQLVYNTVFQLLEKYNK